MTRTPLGDPDPSMDRSTIRVFSEYGCPETPLWGLVGPVHPAELGIPDDLTDALVAWNQSWEPALNADCDWTSPEAHDTYITRGYQLFERLQALDIPGTTFVAQFDDNLPMPEGPDRHEDPQEHKGPVLYQWRA